VLPFSHADGAVIELSRGVPHREGSSGFHLWAEIAGLVGREILRRALAEASQHEAESLCAAVKAEATLGRYMVEMRHNVNNALTSVLGNAELLTLEPGLPANVLDQADTIRNMALRLHEIFQRFSSIEKELLVAARESGKAQVRACAAGR
jgi:signal transduction histidine kinase